MPTNNREQHPLVSFIIAVYDLPIELLRACIESILALSLQTGEREVIVVDDGSEDSPATALEAYGVTYIRQEHGGLSAARNTGIRVAQGEYIQFVDADDLLLKIPYDACLHQARLGSADMILFRLTEQQDWVTTDISASCVATPIFTSPMTGAEYMLHHNLQGSACGYLFRRALLGNLRFTDGIYHEDEEFTPQLILRAERVTATETGAYFYRLRPQSIITDRHTRNTLKRLNDTKGIICRLNRIAEGLPNEKRPALQRRIAQLTMDYLYNIIQQTGSRRYLNRRISELTRQGLFPLPDRDYTRKYQWFRRMTGNRIGIFLLTTLIPLLPKER